MSDLDDIGFVGKLYDHQLKVWRESRDKPAFAVLWEMGLGKSLLIILTALWLRHTGKIDGVITISNKGSYRNWITNELAKFWPAKVGIVAAAWDSYQTKAGQQALGKLCDNQDDTLAWLTINVEAFSSKGPDTFLKAFCKAHKRLLIVVDESTTIKSHSSARAKRVIALTRTGAYRRIMTGSPLPESPLNVWAQFEALGRGLIGPTSYYAFKRRYAVEETRRFGNRSFDVIVGYRGLSSLWAAMAPYSSRLTKLECLDLPEKVFMRIEVELTKEQREVYTKLRDQLLVMLDSFVQADVVLEPTEDLDYVDIGESVVAGDSAVSESAKMASVPFALTKLIRLHQVALGWLQLDDGTVVDLSSNRMDAMLAAIDEITGSVVIWSNYVRAIRMIEASLKKKYPDAGVVTYYGGTSQAERVVAVQKFQEGKVRFFVSNPSVGGYGITLLAGKTVIYFSNSFKAEERLQSQDRPHRIGQTSTVTYIDLIAKGTIDEVVLDALDRKQNVADLVLGDKLREMLG